MYWWMWIVYFVTGLFTWFGMSLLKYQADFDPMGDEFSVKPGSFFIVNTFLWPIVALSWLVGGFAAVCFGA